MRAALLTAAALAGVLGLAAPPVVAAPFVDAASGLKVDPPQPFVVAPAKSQTYDVAVVVNSLTGAPPLGAGDNYLCQIGYQGLPGNADLDQEEINLQVEQPDWLDHAAAAMSRSFDVTGKATFVLDGATGIELVGKPKDSTHASGVFVSMVDTPKGRTTVNCATRPEEIDGAVNQFRLIRASVTLPGTTSN
ncbi:MAG: hypothetical protein P4M09_22760 [Devosia sp.]|nr:hypothetical protein [Devosia sp.]